MRVVGGRGGLEQAGRAYMDRERWRLFSNGHLLSGHSQVE